MRFEVESNGEKITVNPYTGLDFSITYEREEERRYDYQKKIKEVTFAKKDFMHFHNLELSEGRCDQQILRLYSDCGLYSEEFLLYEGTFNMSDGNWDLDQCTVKFSVERFDAYSCIDTDDEERDLFQISLPNQTVNLGITFGTEIMTCCRNGCNPECDDQEIEDGQWIYYTQKVYINFVRINFYVRNYILTPCDYVAPADWILIEACVNGQNKYVRKYQDPAGSEDIDYEYQGSFDLIDLVDPITQIDNGFKLQSVFQSLMDQACGFGALVVSDFFQWNPETQTSISYVTGEQNKYTNLILFQKSDVKRPVVSGNATKAEVIFKELLEAICKIFNCGYRMIDGNLRIEHISWFENNLGMDLVAREGSGKYLDGTRKYDYDSSKLPKYERFSMMEADSEEFIGMDIYYDSNCVNNGEESRKEESVDFITTDLLYCMSNADANSEKVSDDGFVLVACDQNNNVLYEPGILNASTEINNVLAWSHLHRDLWKYGRVLKQGYMNGQLTDFQSTIPVIKQDKFSYLLKCKDIQYFEPLDLINGTLGWGEIKTVEFFPQRCQMDFDLMLQEITRPSNEIIYGDFDENFDPDFD